MKLGAILGGVKVKDARGSMDVEIKGIAYDSRRVAPGDIFIAIKGAGADGHAFIPSAITKGAAAVVYEGTKALALSVPSVRVSSSREAMAFIADNFYGHPSHKLKVVGVTGTNGKTTTTRIIKAIIDASGGNAGLIGTINYVIGQETLPSAHTTPESPDFQALLARMLDRGCTHAVAEVSSHALEQHRVDRTKFRVSVFTNLTRDHLDYHGTMQEYFSAKTRLFTYMLRGPAVINIDDPYGRSLFALVAAGEVITYGIEMGHADLRAMDIKCSARETTMKVSYLDSVHEIATPLVGMVNVYNALAAIGAALALGIGWDEIVRGLSSMPQVPGRFERVEAGQGFLCVVDYAHTEDALERLLHTARQITSGRVITVFGCGGDRDRGKRPAMGSAATTISDMTIITSDNPRSEDPMAIITEITKGAKGEAYRVVPDRERAICEAIDAALDGDTVIIAGKGHEDYQEIKGVRHNFSDTEAARECIAARMAKR